MRRTDIINALVAKGYKASETETIKNGVIFEGIVIRDEDPIAPVIYTQKLIEEAEKKGTGIDEIVSEIIRVYEERKHLEFDVRMMEDREYVLSHLYIALQRESDMDLIKKESGLAGIESYLYVRDVGKSGESYSIKMSDELLQIAEIDPDEAWKSAEQNTFAETEIKSMAKIMSELMGVPYDPAMEAEMPMHVVSNKFRVKGASGILNKNALKIYADEKGTDKILVLPSSTHEMIIVPYTDDIDMESMRAMVRTVNATEVSVEDQLSDNAYIIEV